MDLGWFVELIDAVGLGTAVLLVVLGAAGVWAWRATKGIEVRFTSKVDEVETKVAAKVDKKVEEVQENLKTNHGSTSAGNAIDRLTTSVWEIRDLLGPLNSRIAKHEEDFQVHLVESAKAEARLTTLEETMQKRERDTEWLVELAKSVLLQRVKPEVSDADTIE